MLDIDPIHSDAHFKLGILYEKSAEYEQAEEHLKVAIKSNSLDVDAYVALGKLLLQGERLLEAEELCNDALRMIGDQNPHIFLILAVVYENVGKCEESLEKYNAVMKTQGRSSTYLIKCSRLHGRLSKYKEALKLVDEALKQEPKDFDALMLRGGILLALGRTEEASKVFAQAAANGAVNFDLFYQMGR